MKRYNIKSVKPITVQYNPPSPPHSITPSAAPEVTSVPLQPINNEVQPVSPLQPSEVIQPFGPSISLQADFASVATQMPNFGNTTIPQLISYFNQQFLICINNYLRSYLPGSNAEANNADAILISKTTIFFLSVPFTLNFTVGTQPDAMYSTFANLQKANSTALYGASFLNTWNLTYSTIEIVYSPPPPNFSPPPPTGPPLPSPPSPRFPPTPPPSSTDLMSYLLANSSSPLTMSSFEELFLNQFEAAVNSFINSSGWSSYVSVVALSTGYAPMEPSAPPPLNSSLNQPPINQTIGTIRITTFLQLLSAYWVSASKVNEIWLK